MVDSILDESVMAPMLSALSIAISLAASAHVLLKKRETRAAIGWIGLIWLSPIVGTVLYVLLGINRIHRKARSLRGEKRHPSTTGPDVLTLDDLYNALPSDATHLIRLAELVGRLTDLPLLAGNQVETLRNGDEAYPAMIDSINRANRSIGLCTYIFNDDPAGRRFVEALKRAVERGVAVRVLVDDVGSRYDLPTVMRLLRHAGVPSATFLPTLKPGWFPYFNLRSHRKILVVDGQDGFTGGMNIDKDYDHSLNTRHPKIDTHFHVRGPVVAHLLRTFAEDWTFKTGEALDGDAWFPTIDTRGTTFARGVPSGPDEVPDKILVTILGALATARASIMIVTPYFVPDETLRSALSVAAMRGVPVDIVLPDDNNLALVQWAAMSLLPELLESGCQVWLAPRPFDHTKLMIVDDTWALVGSANWDARSFRLNFEFNLECYDRELALELAAHVKARIDDSQPITLDHLRGRSLPVQLRDNIARLFSPYL